MRICHATVMAAALAACTAPLAAQRPLPADTARAVTLDAVVVTAERSAAPLGASLSAVSRVAARELAPFPQVTVADALRHMPGIALVSFDGLGFDPQVMVRGFYGAGEAEYVIVLLDGKPINQLQSGVVSWDVIPSANVEAIEVVRGGASTLYGDAAIGGVINIITRDPAAAWRPRWSAAGGAHDTWRLGAAVGVPLGGQRMALTAAADQTGGARAHSERTVLRAAAAAPLLASARTALDVSARSQRRDYDEPGPLLASIMATDRTASDDLFRFDHTIDDTHALAIDGSRTLTNRARVSAVLLGELRSVGAVRTLALAPGFGDTKERELETRRGFGSAQFELPHGLLSRTDRLIIGTDLTLGALESRYYRVVTGPRAAYRSSSGERSELDASGSGSRLAAGLFAHYTMRPAEALRIAAGARTDRVSDAFQPQAPSASTSSIETSHSAFSPSLSVNLRYLQRGTAAGHLYITTGRSFKAPTLDQLFDQRSFPVPFPPFRVTTSNTELKPQYGTSVEAGLYHGGALSGGTLRATASIAWYQMRMRDELDFDLSTLRYVNVGSSQHRGVEAGVQLQGSRSLTGFVNYTLQAPTARSGQHDGKYLKNIPRHTVNAGVAHDVIGALQAGVELTHARDAHIDDENTTKLEPYTRVDARVSYALRGVRLFVDVRNLLDAKYSTVAFFDPSGSGEIYHFPAAGRVLELGVRSGQ